VGDVGDELLADPDLVATVYFDARVAEVSAWLGGHRHAGLRQMREVCGRELDKRWVRNIMLSKWLEYLEDRGHYFPSKADLSS
jgi:uncharacterized protein YqiB (DUF1249 family)